VCRIGRDFIRRCGQRLVSANDSYQGMTSVMPQRIPKKIRASAPMISFNSNIEFFTSPLSHAVFADNRQLSTDNCLLSRRVVTHTLGGTSSRVHPY
jgi:hypothetical protein